jgi:hypothetical protein
MKKTLLPIVFALSMFFLSCKHTGSQKQKNTNNTLQETSKVLVKQRSTELVPDTIHCLDYSNMMKFFEFGRTSIQGIHFAEGYQVSDTLFETEDGDEWPGLLFSKDGVDVLLVETSWQNTNVIFSMSILSNSINTPDSIRVGDHWGRLRKKVSRDIPTMPDGYFAVRSKNHPSVLCFLEVDEKMHYGNTTYDKIPAEQRVEYIMIEKPR